MEIPNNHRGVFVGSVCTIASLLLTFTFGIPFAVVLVGFLISWFFEIFANANLKGQGIFTLLVLTLSLTGVINFWRRKIKRFAEEGRQLEIPQIFGIMASVFVVIHPLIFFAYWGLMDGFSNDDEVILGSIVTFPISSLSFLFLGIMFDYFSTRLLLGKKNGS